jgi:hypothetical protein
MTSTTNRQFDPLSQFNRAPARSDLARGLPPILGAVMVVSGLAVGVWLVVNISRMLNSSPTPPLVQRLTPATAEDLAMVLPAGKVELPPAFFAVAGHMIAVSLLFLVTLLALSLIRWGASLVRASIAPPQAKDADKGA